MEQHDDIEVVVQTDPRTILGEGPMWDVNKQVLYWVDIRGEKLHIYNPSTKTNRSIQVHQTIGAVVPRAKGGVVLALQHGFYFMDLDTEKLEPIVDPEHDKPENRFNDGKCDQKGRFYAGTLEIAEKNGPLGALYMLDTDLSIKTILSRHTVEISNGLAWAPDGKTVYFIDSPLKRVDAFDVNVDSGEFGNRRTVITIAEGWPDGMTIDTEGKLWVAHWAGSCVTRWDPTTGQLLRKVKLPVSKVTSCCFGGKNLDVLYVTSASYEIDTKVEPLAGAVFLLKNPGVTGRPEPSFQG